ncbi:MAG: ABC transporter permease subunit [Actinobacteria bacterium]|nr:ABC transporter permease subunit [Actinomycetota bacterium]
MSARATFATARRVLWQIRRDPRTVALLIGVPSGMMFLLKLVLEDREATFQFIGIPLLGLFPLISMFLVTSITMLRERSTGTLERLMTMPISKLDVLAGYGLAFGLLAVLQGAVVSAVGFGLLGLDANHPILVVIGLAVANALLGMSLGLSLSALARTEFQAVQFMPAIIFPQLLLCGLLVERSQMSPVLEAISNVLPMTYAYDALDRVATSPELGSEVTTDVVVVIGVTLVALALGALTLRRRTL